jgi:hypothetical protein
MDYTGEIGVNDHICLACYRAHLVVIKRSINIVESLDKDLASMIKKLKGEVQDEQDIHTVEQAVTNAALQTAILVAETLLDQNAILLPEVWDYFEKKISDLSRKKSFHHDFHDIANAHWLLSQLSAVLQQHMAYRCSVKRYGTVIYRYGGDLLHALNISLGKSRATAQGKVDMDFQKQLHEVCLSLNAKCHAVTHN